MHTNIFQTINIIVKSLYSVLKISTDTIAIEKKNKLTRTWVNKRIYAWAKQIIGYTKANWRVINPNNIAPKPGQPTIIMCNHASLYDIPFTYLAFPNETIRMLAKKELKKIPFFGRTIELAGHLFIDRQNRQQAINNLNKMRKFLADDIVMWIAPEGTRSADGKLAPFKKGGFITAIQAQATIIPIVIRGANLILPARSLNFSLNQNVDIMIGQPVDASEYSLEQKNELINLVHNSMQSMLDQKND